jgi:hypothetical protein
VTAATTSVTTDEKIDAKIDVAKMITTAITTVEKSGLHHHRQEGATPMVRSSRRTERSTSLSVVAKRPKATDRSDETQGRLGMSTQKTRSLCDGLCETWVPLGPYRRSSRPSPTSGFGLLEDLPTCQWAQMT